MHSLRRSPLGRVLEPGALVAAAGLIAACSASGAPSGIGDDSNAQEDGVRVCAAGATVDGVDVSVHNGHIDWAKVKAAGKTFAIARVSYGSAHDDTEFPANWAGIKSAGLVRGVYQYFRPSQDAVAQADVLLAKVGAFEAGDLPPVIDVEVSEGMSNAAVVNGVRAWIDRVKAKTGIDAIVYTGPGFWNPLPNTAQFAGQKLWDANYTNLCPSMPATWTDWAFWQSSETGAVPGISGNVDLDRFNGPLSALHALAVGGQAQPGCVKDADCNMGTPGAGVICVSSQCIDGCHADVDCPAGESCDTQSAQCAKSGSLPLGAPCADDAQCGAAGQERVCDAASHVCATGCHVDGDCPASDTCDPATSQCAAPQPPPPPPGCPVLTFPSGIEIQTVEDAATTASYQGHLAAGQSAPECFLDTDNLHDPAKNVTYDLSVHVAANFQLSELVGTEVSQGYGHFVLMSPAAVASLQAFRMSVGGPVSVNSGFRSPKHQEATCISICGNPMGCPGTCANNSRHMWGDAFDLPLAFYNVADTNLACADGFKFTYLESGTHLHIDQNPAYAQCVQQ